MKKIFEEKLLTIVKRNYEDIAEEFDQTRKNLVWPELLKFCELVRENDLVLDVGCGNGRLLNVFKNKKINYIGIDNSASLIKLAKNNYFNSNCKFLVGNILDLDKVVAGQFDFIFCIAVLHHIPGQELQVKALKQLRKKLNKDGRIVVSVWNFWTRKKFLKMIFKNFLLKVRGKNSYAFNDLVFNWRNMADKKRYYHAFYSLELKKIIKKSGLNIEKYINDGRNYYLILR